MSNSANSYDTVKKPTRVVLMTKRPEWTSDTDDFGCKECRMESAKVHGEDPQP